MTPDPGDELVPLYDESGRPSGEVVARREMRARNLRHAATVVVRSPRGEVYVHRRTDTKDVFPGHYDFAAGGVLFTCVYDGPVTLQPEEVAWGECVDVARLREMVATLPFVPDTIAVLGALQDEG